MYTFSPNAYKEAGFIWKNGKHPEDGSEPVVMAVTGIGVARLVPEAIPRLHSPNEHGFSAEIHGNIAKKLGADTELKRYCPRSRYAQKAPLRSFFYAALALFARPTLWASTVL